MAETRSWSLSRGAIGRSRRDLAIRSLRRHGNTANFLFRESADDIPRPGSAPKDKRTLTAGGGKNNYFPREPNACAWRASSDCPPISDPQTRRSLSCAAGARRAKREFTKGSSAIAEEPSAPLTFGDRRGLMCAAGTRRAHETCPALNPRTAATRKIEK